MDNSTTSRPLPGLAMRMDDLSVLDHSLLAAAIAAFTVLAWWTLAYIFSPLRRYPGPFLAGYTNLWRLFLVRNGRYPSTIKKLHAKYGPVLRIGPNTLDLDIPELIKVLYGTDGKWIKTNFYHVNSTKVNGQIVYNLFSTTDQTEHAMMKRPVGKQYSPGSVLGIEPLIDMEIGKMCDLLEERFINGGSTDCDLGSWVSYCAWDMVGAATFSEDFDYMNKGCDHDGTIGIADSAIRYFSIVGQIPFLDFLLDKNPVLRIGPPNLGNVTMIALNRIGRRRQGQDPNYDPAVQDYLQRFLDAQAEQPDVVHDGFLMNYVFINLIAGADTTATTIRAVLYLVARDRYIWDKLEKEILDANLEGKVVSYNLARVLPYLEACVREALRVHPGVAMLLERYVPEGGLVLPDGSTVPAGTAVGINPYVVGRNEEVWGEDADTFRPERWLPHEGETTESETYKQRMRLFNATDLAFGAGSRICMGRHFAFVEVYKMVATLVKRYNIELAYSNRDWKVHGLWFPRQEGIICRLTKREGVE